METGSEMSMLKLMFGTPPRNKKLVVPRNIPLEELRRKVAEKFDLPESQPFKLLVVPADFPPDKLNERAAQTSELEIVVFKPLSWSVMMSWILKTSCTTGESELP